MRACRRAKSILERCLEGRARLEETFELEEHLRQCTRCRDLHDRARALEEALTEMPAPPVERLDVERVLSGMHDELDQGVGAASDSYAPFPLRSRRGWLVAAALLLIAPALWFGWRSFGSAERDAPGTADSVAALQELPADSKPNSSEESSALNPPDLETEPVLAQTVALTTDFDGARWERVRGEVAEALRSTGARLLLVDSEADSMEDFLVAFDTGTRGHANAGWPLARIVQGLCLDHEASVAVPALRYLGVRGDRAALRVVAQALDRPELERAACLSLIDAGAAGLPALERAFWDPDLSTLIQEEIAAISSFAPLEAFGFIEALLEDTRSARPNDERRVVAAGLPALLAKIEAPGSSAAIAARALLDYVGHPLLERGAVLDALAKARGADEVLWEATERARGSERESVLLEAIARATPEVCFDWVERRTRSSRVAGKAFAALAAYPCEEALLALLEVRPHPRSGDDVAYYAALRSALELDHERTAALAANPYVVADPPSGRRFLEALVASESPAAVPGLIELARRTELDEDDRERALLTIGEMGHVDHLFVLSEFLEELSPREARLAAAAVWAVHNLDPNGALDALLVGAGPDTMENVRAILARPEANRRRTATLFQLARALNPWLERRLDSRSDA